MEREEELEKEGRVVGAVAALGIRPARVEEEEEEDDEEEASEAGAWAGMGAETPKARPRGPQRSRRGHERRDQCKSGSRNRSEGDRRWGRGQARRQRPQWD